MSPPDLTDAHHASGTLPAPLAMVFAMLLIVANGGFVAAEFALVRVRIDTLRERARRGERAAAIAQRLAERLDESLSVCQVGITLASLALGWIGEPAFGSLFARVLSPVSPWLGAVSASAAIGLAFLTVTVLHVVLGELVPKSLAIALAERVSIAVAWPMLLFRYASWPLVAGLNAMAWWTLKPFGLSEVQETGDVTRDEIRRLLVASARRGRFSEPELRVIDNLFRFAGRRAREMMIPRSDVVALDVRRGFEHALEVVRAARFSRFPLIDGDLDRVVGVVHVRDLFRVLASGETADLAALARPAPMIPETLTAEQLLERFQKERAHLAIVVDEYGGVSGIVTLEDVLEELVGELRDEFDAGEVDPVRPRPGGGYSLAPSVPADVACELVDDPPTPPEEVVTVAGWLQAALGRLPRSGDAVRFGSRHRLVAARVRGNRVMRVDLVPDDDRAAP